MNLNLEWMKKFARGAATFSKKNLPSIMIGGSIIGFWTAAIMIAKQAPNAQKEIEYENAKRGEDDKEPLNWKDKTIIYGKHCWAGGALCLASTGLAIGAHKIDLSRIAEMYMLSQFYKEDGEKLKKQILKKKDGEKELKGLRNDIIADDYDEEMQNIEEWVSDVPGKGDTLFIDVTTNKRWTDDIVNVMNGFNKFNERMRSGYNRKIIRIAGDAFKSYSGSPHEMIQDDPECYYAESLDILLEDIGEADEVISDSALGNLLEIRCYNGEGDILRTSQILKYKQYKDPETGIPKVCFIDYHEYLAPSSELLERYPG